jgi:hypothetical protein
MRHRFRNKVKRWTSLDLEVPPTMFSFTGTYNKLHPAARMQRRRHILDIGRF